MKRTHSLGFLHSSSTKGAAALRETLYFSSTSYTPVLSSAGAQSHTDHAGEQLSEAGDDDDLCAAETGEACG
ncbi:hypothetical protein HG530_011018 [Fusarium avenaceum]|nr:hypothetical protein HG530_011018 [Fusarium avenaceum]